ncbi:MAG: methionyl-tRNA formyltransferase [Anaerolineales bacterium]
MPARVVFMGSPEFSLPSLRALAENYEVVGVVTQPDRPAGRGKQLAAPPVKLLAQELGIPVIPPRRLREPEAMRQLREWAPEVIVVAAFGQILRQEVLDLPPKGCINVHASLLPRWRGASPIQAAILHGDQETGVTIMLMDAGLDTGPILSQRSIPIGDDDTAATLNRKLSTFGAELLTETLPKYLEGELKPKPQPSAGVTTMSTLNKADGKLDPSEGAIALERKVRAFTPWPGAFIEWKSAPLKVHAAHTVNNKRGKPGQHTEYQGLPSIATVNGWLVLDVVQPAGKKQMSGVEFLRGARDWATTN